MKKLYWLIILFLSYKICNAQTPDWEWARCPVTGNSTGVGEGWRNAIDKVGNNYLVGSYRDTLVFDVDTLILIMED
jgi:hypothetical protein